MYEAEKCNDFSVYFRALVEVEFPVFSFSRQGLLLAKHFLIAALAYVLQSARP